MQANDRTLNIGDTVDNGVITEDEALMRLGDEFHGYSFLEYKFDCLLRDQDTLEWWRRRTA
jgi:hypothetical protein